LEFSIEVFLLFGFTFFELIFHLKFFSLFKYKIKIINTIQVLFFFSLSFFHFSGFFSTLAKQFSSPSKQFAIEFRITASQMLSVMPHLFCFIVNIQIDVSLVSAAAVFC